MSCQCGGKKVPVKPKKAAAKKPAPKKGATVKPKKSAASKAAAKKATAVAKSKPNPYAKGCKC